MIVFFIEYFTLKLLLLLLVTLLIDGLRWKTSLSIATASPFFSKMSTQKIKIAGEFDVLFNCSCSIDVQVWAGHPFVTCWIYAEMDNFMQLSTEAYWNDVRKLKNESAKMQCLYYAVKILKITIQKLSLFNAFNLLECFSKQLLFLPLSLSSLWLDCKRVEESSLLSLAVYFLHY